MDLQLPDKTALVTGASTGIGRGIGEPEDMANPVCSLSSPLASCITGAVTLVDGGLRRYQF